MKLRKDCDLLDQKLSSVYMKAHLLRGNIFFVLLNTILQIYIYTYVIYICVSQGLITTLLSEPSFQNCGPLSLPLRPHHPITSQRSAICLFLPSSPSTCYLPDRKPRGTLVVLILTDLYGSNTRHCLPSLGKFSHTQARATRCRGTPVTLSSA